MSKDEVTNIREIKQVEGKTIAKLTIETIANEPELWGEIFDRITILFTDGDKIRLSSMFCTTNHSAISEEI